MSHLRRAIGHRLPVRLSTSSTLPTFGQPPNIILLTTHPHQTCHQTCHRPPRLWPYAFPRSASLGIWPEGSTATASLHVLAHAIIHRHQVEATQLSSDSLLSLADTEPRIWNSLPVRTSGEKRFAMANSTGWLSWSSYHGQLPSYHSPVIRYISGTFVGILQACCSPKLHLYWRFSDCPRSHIPPACSLPNPSWHHHLALAALLDSADSTATRMHCSSNTA